MNGLLETQNRRPERVFLVAAELKSHGNGWQTRDSLEELAQLVVSAGGRVVGEGVQKVDSLHPATFIGRGKAEAFAAQCRQQQVDTVVFDDELTPAQHRNLEKIFQCRVLDRTALILDIFAQRARTREGKLQVELARLQHLLPRLTRAWGHLSRQRGGIGVRGGEGESQLEMDRRRVLDRIARIERELDEVRRQRTLQRVARKRHQYPLASLVGYTNAGKSTLLNALTGAGVLAEDKLFATLDPTTRRLQLPTRQEVLLSDTVGFIRKLPHQLVEAFKATLEEVTEADLLLHVVDISHPLAEEQMAAVDTVLQEIHADQKPTLVVFNKVDRLPRQEVPARFFERHPHAVAVSALTGQGLSTLLEEIARHLRPARQLVRVAIPHERADLIARLHSVGQIVERRYHPRTARFKVHLSPQHLQEFAPYIVERPETPPSDAEDLPRRGSPVALSER
ncbi:GTPase HflX [Limisphaera sp. 4302-co]|uniref:GTPase HflX n=1 Tax=Limisphaera sp. 4302-co TaxID=3400417 RepID=UPI003C23D42A